MQKCCNQKAYLIRLAEDFCAAAVTGKGWCDKAGGTGVGGVLAVTCTFQGITACGLFDRQLAMGWTFMGSLFWTLFLFAHWDNKKQLTYREKKKQEHHLCYAGVYPARETVSLPQSCTGWHSPGFLSTKVWPSSQRGTSGRLQLTRSHTTVTGERESQQWRHQGKKDHVRKINQGS